MSSINILHLSDLHITSKKLSFTSKKLIADIVEQTLNMNEIMIIVSGDLIDKGEYIKYRDGVKLFFQTLKDNIGKKIKGIYIVPGNHDKERSVSNELYGKLSQLQSIEITKDIWELQNDNYRSYIELVTEIRKIFKPRIKRMSQTFGVEYCEFEEDVVCLIEIDTSWGTYGGKEENGKLIIGNYQLECLLRQYEEIKEDIESKEKEITLTIGIAHHPVVWLNPNEEKLLKKYMIDEEYFNMNLYLCGHIHDMEVENWYNNEHSIMTLVTGIGWNHQIEGSKEKDKKDEHRYSLYIIDVKKNSCDIIMRRSQKNGKFISDYSVYVSDEQKIEKLCYPLRIENNNQPFININSPQKEFVRSIFVDMALMEKIKVISGEMLLFQKKCVELLMYYKREYLERLADMYDENSKEYNDAYTRLYNRFFYGDHSSDANEDIFLKGIDVVYEIFTAFLQDVLVNFVDIFAKCFIDESNIRVHFRWYDQKKDEYRKLCQYSNVDQKDGPNVSEISWGGLIEQSYLLGKSLIYSANQKYNNHEPVRWDDFMTVVPSFFKSEQEIRGVQNKKMKRPLMTFGISVLNHANRKYELSKVLYILEYLDLAQLLTNVLDDFISDFTVDYTKYLAYIEAIRI